MVITRFIRNLKRSSNPFLAEADDGHQYVVKSMRWGTPPNLLFNECAGSALYRACGLDVPEWKPILLTKEFIDQNRHEWTLAPRGLIGHESGLAFGSRYLGETGKPLFQILPGSDYPRVINRHDFWLAWLLDACCFHTDNRQAIFLQLENNQFRAVFIDHGNNFGGPAGGSKCPPEASRYLDSRIYDTTTGPDPQLLTARSTRFDEVLLWDQINRIPRELRTYSAIASFCDCLTRLKNTRLISSIADSLASRIFDGMRSERPNDVNSEQQAAEVLCSVVRRGQAECVDRSVSAGTRSSAS